MVLRTLVAKLGPIVDGGEEGVVEPGPGHSGVGVTHGKAHSALAKHVKHLDICYFTYLGMYVCLYVHLYVFTLRMLRMICYVVYAV